eukprot:CAMPEP_0171339254 /NCGR_PEP_ID=MMETSP0878-20121228/7843_1 /TAXON_ID=67004 /ORGANISM="Thalassiosira weissflogii, Strain CCMP1336" /LENGTH=299 /DNA_ID=CAMNT_0011841151 /DNA_START=89 /DNA_END=988 /DNA_ORIENTATION=-
MDRQQSFVRSLSAIHLGDGALRQTPRVAHVNSEKSKANETEKSGFMPRPAHFRRHSDDAFLHMKRPIKSNIKKNSLCPRSRRVTVSNGRDVSLSMSAPNMTFEATTQETFEEANDDSNLRGGKKKTRHRGFRSDYTLGMFARSLNDMIVVSDEDAALESASSLKNFDFAFIKRGDGHWSYSILAYRSHETSNKAKDYMVFILDKSGATKTIKRSKWGSYVRLVAKEEDFVTDLEFDDEEMKPVCEDQEIKTAGEKSVPKIVSLPSKIYQDDVPIISNISLPKMNAAYHKPLQQSSVRAI